MPPVGCEPQRAVGAGQRSTARVAPFPTNALKYTLS